MQCKKLAFHISTVVWNVFILTAILALVLTLLTIPLFSFILSTFGWSSEDGIVTKIQGIAANELKFEEPLVMEDIDFIDGKNGFKIKFTLKIIRVVGVNNLTLKYAKGLNKEDTKYELNLNTPKLYLSSQYFIEGAVDYLKFFVSGPMKINFKNVTAVLLLRSHSKPNPYLESLLETEPVINISFVDSSVYTDDPFRGTSELSEVLKKNMRLNWNRMALKMKPNLEKLLAEKYMVYFNSGYACNPRQLTPNNRAFFTALLMTLRLVALFYILEVLRKLDFRSLPNNFISKPIFLPGINPVFD